MINNACMELPRGTARSIRTGGFLLHQSEKPQETPEISMDAPRDTARVGSGSPEVPEQKGGLGVSALYGNSQTGWGCRIQDKASNKRDAW